MPEDLGRYYPADYWQFQKDRHRFAPDPWLKRLMRHQRAKYWLFHRRNITGRLLASGRLQPRYFGWLRRGRVDFDSTILDVGCGLGDRLLELAKDGFGNLTGIDPFIKGDLRYESGVRVWKRELSKFEGRFDFIMLHHAFEHMPDPAEALGHLHRLLRPGRTLLIRIPVADSWAWRHYGVHWFQLDAPRHLFLHTRESMERLAEGAGFHIREVIRDSLIDQFICSEQYRRGIPLYAEGSWELDPENGVFSKAELDEFRHRAREFNASGEGDQACFYLERPAK